MLDLSIKISNERTLKIKLWPLTAFMVALLIVSILWIDDESISFAIGFATAYTLVKSIDYKEFYED